MRLNISVVCSEENVKADYLKNRPAFEDFFTVDG